MPLPFECLPRSCPALAGGPLGRFYRVARSSGLLNSAASCGVPSPQPSLCLHGTLFVPSEGPRFQGGGVQLEPVPAQHTSSGCPQAPVCEPEPRECPEPEQTPAPGTEALQPAQGICLFRGELSALIRSHTTWEGHPGQTRLESEAGHAFSPSSLYRNALFCTSPWTEPLAHCLAGLSDAIVLVSCFGSPCSSWCEVQASILGALFLVFCLTSRLFHFIPTTHPLSFSLFEAAGSFIQWLKYLVIPSRRSERHREPPLLFRQLRLTPSAARDHTCRFPSDCWGPTH